MPMSVTSAPARKAPAVKACARPGDEGRGSMPTARRGGRELLCQGAADALGRVLVELLRVQAPHVVRLEDPAGDGHEPCFRHEPSLPCSGSQNWMALSGMCVSGYTQMPPARRLPAPITTPSPMMAD